MKNIILIGMPGAGKSTIGVILAKTLGLDFIDTDLIIQHREKRMLQDIIDNDGIKGFIEIEKDAILSLDCEDSVIATGGSVVLSEEAMEHLKRLGTVIFIDVSYKEIERRIKNITTRGIVKSKDKSLLDTYKERLPLYKKFADATVIAKNKTSEEIVTEIKDKGIFR
ncbi:MAG: shikimate kinase [Eubacteriales bacterium]|nr:shikimate kinase [Eubacteriales bacterium]